MKKIIRILMLLTCFNHVFGQNINWNPFKAKQKTFAYLNMGYDFGLSTQLGIGYKLTEKQPIVLLLDYSLTAGEKIFDDAKTRVGLMLPIFGNKNVLISTKIQAVNIRHQTKFVKMTNFGIDLSVKAGYYKPTWYMATDVGFYKSFTTHLKHSALMKANFPTISDGWYSPSGGYFFYGIQGGKSLNDNLTLSLMFGATNAQFKHKNAVLPYYFQFGVIWWKSKRRV